MANKDFKDYAIAGSNVTLTYDDVNDTVTFAAQGNVQSVNGKTGVVVINKSDVSLGSVDNTSDVNKPISSATQTALDSKQTSIVGSIKTADNLAITSTLKNLSDNVGNSSAIDLSTSTLRVNGYLNIKGSGSHNVDIFYPADSNSIFTFEPDVQNQALSFGSSRNFKSWVSGIFYYGGSHTFFSDTTTQRMILTTNGDLGIGTASPTAKLDVNGTARIQKNTESNLVISETGGFQGDVASLYLIGNQNTWGSSIRYNVGAGGIDNRLDFYRNLTSIGFSLKDTGNVLIGTTTDSGFKLAVNGNIKNNNTFQGFTSIAASGTQIILTIDSTPYYVITGSGGQVIKLPDATTLPNGATFTFNNNQSSGAITINNNSNTLIASVPSGGDTVITLLSNSIAAGSWERHELAPSNVSWSTNTLDYAGSITSATWNGVAIADAKISSAATWNAKQDALVSGTNIKTLEGQSLLGSGNIDLAKGDVGLGNVDNTSDANKPVSTAQQTALDTKTNKLIVANRQTASYTLVLSDADKLVEMNVATANNLTIPLNSSVAFAIGTQILLAQYGAGQTTIVATGGVTVRSNGGKLKLNVQYSGATLIKIATDEWYLFGDIA
jgi:hypothetical protein